MEEPYRTDPDPPHPRQATRWWQGPGWPSYRELIDGLAFVGLLLPAGAFVGMMASGLVARALGRVGRDGYATPDSILAGMIVGPVLTLAVGVVSVVGGTSRLRWGVALGVLVLGALCVAVGVVFPPHP